MAFFSWRSKNMWGALVTVVTVGFILVMILPQALLSKDIRVENGVLNIPGMFGKKVELSSITNVELSQTPPELGGKIMGSGLGANKRGTFAIPGGSATVYLEDANKTPVILIETTDKPVYINFRDASKTTALYGQITRALED